MARKTYQGTGLLPGLEEESTPKARARTREVSPARVITLVALAGLLLLISFFAFSRLERVLIRDPRFALNGAESSPESATLEVVGAVHASRRHIESVFADDSGRSVYLLPLSDRRATLRAVDWVKDASVVRLWPNRVIVSIAERKPV